MRYRVLAIPHGKEADADGRTLGDDWLRADLGCDDDGTHYYVTTDRVHASDSYSEHAEPAEMARWIVDELHRRGRKTMRALQKAAKKARGVPVRRVGR